MAFLEIRVGLNKADQNLMNRHERVAEVESRLNCSLPLLKEQAL